MIRCAHKSQNILSEDIARSGLGIYTNDWILRRQSCDENNHHKNEGKDLDHLKVLQINNLLRQKLIVQSNRIYYYNIKGMEWKQKLTPRKRYKIFRNELFAEPKGFQIVPYHFQVENTYVLDHQRGKIYASCQKDDKKKRKDQRKQIRPNRPMSQGKSMHILLAKNGKEKEKQKKQTMQVKPYISECFLISELPNTRYLLQTTHHLSINNTKNSFSMVKTIQNRNNNPNKTHQTQPDSFYSKQNKVMSPQQYFNFMKKTKTKRYQKLRQMNNLCKTLSQRIPNTKFSSMPTKKGYKQSKQNHIYHI